MLFEGVFKVLDVEPADALDAVVDESEEVPVAGARHVGVGRAGARVVPRNGVAVVRPQFLVLLQKARVLGYVQVQLRQHRVALEALL